MWTAIFLIIIYIFWIRTFIEMACIGKSLFFPDFKEIGKAYSYVGYNWNSWHGRLLYYFGLMFNLIVALIVTLIVFYIKMYILSYILASLT